MQLVQTTPKFDPEIHPELVFRAALMGLHKTAIAELCGLPGQVLDEWVAQYPDLQEAFDKAKEADTKVLHALYCLATGWNQYTDCAAVDKDGLHKRGDRAAAIAWLKYRKIWQETETRPPGAPKSLPELLGIVRELEQRLIGTAEPRTITAAAQPGPPDEEPDAGF